MLKNALTKLAKRSNRRFKEVAFERRSAVIEMIVNDHRSKSYNPKSLKHKSIKSAFDNGK